MVTGCDRLNSIIVPGETTTACPFLTPEATAPIAAPLAAPSPSSAIAPIAAPAAAPRAALRTDRSPDCLYGPVVIGTKDDPTVNSVKRISSELWPTYRPAFRAFSTRP